MHKWNFPPTSTLRPIIPENTRTFCLTAAAGTEFAGAFYAQILASSFLEKSSLRPLEPSSCTRNCWIMLAHIVQDSRLLPSKTKSGPSLSSSVADHPLRSAKDNWLGTLLSHQLPNPTQAHQKARCTLLYIMYFRLQNSLVDTYALRTRLPCRFTSSTHIRLACLMHYASVPPGPR